jgi:hypothetical protein
LHSSCSKHLTLVLWVSLREMFKVLSIILFICSFSGTISVGLLLYFSFEISTLSCIFVYILYFY